MVLWVVPVDVLLAERREQLVAESLRDPGRRRCLFRRVGAGGGEELDEPLGVARERHALGAQLTASRGAPGGRSWSR